MAAAQQLLAEDGYDRISIEAIAQAAGVSRPTIYRRWPSKAHLVFDAAFGAVTDGQIPFAAADFDANLRTFVGGMLTFWQDPVVKAAALGLLAERRRDPALHIRTQQLLDERTRQAFYALVQNGIDQDAVRADIDVEMLYQLLVGTAFYATQVDQCEDVEELTDRMCTLVMQGARGQPQERRNHR
jgi:AcrR family transcriptional regulator